MADPQTAEIVYADGSSEGLRVSSIAPGRYRLEESSLLGEAVFGDVIEATMTPDGRLQFKGVAAPSEMSTVRFILTRRQINAPGLQPLLDHVMALGGNWERALGGVLFVHLPKSVHMDIESEISSLSAK